MMKESLPKLLDLKKKKETCLFVCFLDFVCLFFPLNWITNQKTGFGPTIQLTWKHFMFP